MSPSRIGKWIIRHLPGGHLPNTPVAIAFHRPIPGTYRGKSLWLLCVVIALKGIGYIIRPSPTADDALTFVTKIAPVGWWGALFIGVCLYAMLMSYCHHGRDQYGYNAIAGLSFGWAGAFAVTPLFFHGPGYAWQGFLTWAVIGGFCLYLSGYPDPAIDQNAIRCES